MLQSSQLFQLTSSRREWREHPTQQRSRVMHFNSHPHEEDDEADCSSGVAAIVFQLTSSRRGWLVREAFIYYTSHFNSHPHEEDDNVHWWRCCISEISTHILTKRMTTTSCPMTRICYFNSHPHEEDDGFLSAHMEVIYISTHILTKRMTKSVIRFVREILISTHILTKRMTGIIPCRFSFPDISTHILTKRMTVLQRTEKFKLSFQLTSSRRGWRRCFIIIWCYEQKLFQLTSSRRGWQS